MTVYQHVLPGDDEQAAITGARAIFGALVRDKPRGWIVSCQRCPIRSVTIAATIRS
jgi:hypothetical protein